MLVELTIRNFAVIRDTRIEFVSGFNALTGETGAGKSIVIDALGAVLGTRVSSDFVRTGESQAYVEAVFDLSGSRPEPVHALLDEYGVEYQADEPLVLSRNIYAVGRSTARVNGRALTASALQQIGELLVDIHGQSEHLSLLRPSAQLELLDRFAGTVEQRATVARQFRQWRETRRRLQSFDEERRERAQRLDALRYEIEEIDGVAPESGEDEELRRERNILSNAERLARSAADAHSALSGGSDDSMDSGALDRVRIAESLLDDMREMDDGLNSLAEQLRESLFSLEEISGEIRDYGERVQFDPDRLATIDGRLDDLRKLLRKYGPDLESVIAYRSQIQEEIDDLEKYDVDLESLREQEQQDASALADLARQLSNERGQSATELSRLVAQTISELNMGQADFKVRLETVPDENGIDIHGTSVAIDSTGMDEIAFYLAVNKGEELRPLGRVASGGETARLMLALKSILSDADETPTLIFDEIDVGVGGRSGQVVGEKLWSLTGSHQVIVISHLPQVAAFADRHITMIKRETDGRTETSATSLETDESIDEIATMFDGMPVTPESRANATALVKRVSEWKERVGSPSRVSSASLL